jgi:thiol-disulfide isomerase/thioredoxin
MSRPILTFALTLGCLLFATVALESLVHAPMSAQALNPLTGSHADVRPALPWRNSSWLNTPDGKPLTLASLRGRVVLLNFWTFTCWNCIGALPSMVEFDRRYRAAGLTIIGMHSPEFPPYGGEHDRANVEAALRKYHLEYPTAQDNDHATWDLYDIGAWPSFVLIDRRGVLRYQGAGEFHIGDATDREWDARIQRLLAER